MYSCLSCCKPVKKTHQNTGKYCNLTCQADHRKAKNRIAVEAGLASSRTVKLYLIEKHGEVCLDPNCVWDFAKRPIGVELEHIDGNSTNNNLSNCTLLCPNCHSTTPTYKNRNMGNGRASRRERYHAGKSY